jgi:hypothetical protein
VAAGYTFLPWCRQGMVAELDAPPANQPLAQRAAVKVGMTITNAGTGGVDVTLLGPGDVTGIDPRLVVRTEPRRGTTTFEANLLAAVDFDLPDLPWLLTPAGAQGNDLQPWIALVVVEVGAGVSLGLRPGALLPVLTIDGEADARTELPHPASTALWAHGQVLADEAITAGALPAELAAHPARNVSRLVCPRRLRAGARYYACVVPTFDAGVIRGLGGTPREGDPLGPAWGTTAGAELPVYHHWEFSTGPEGDFETLAARLRPHQSSARVGRVPMHIGAAHPGLGELPEGDPAAIVEMDGALRAPGLDDLRLQEVDERVRAGLTAALNAPAAQAAGEDAPLVVGPPMYGAWHANHHGIDDGTPLWLGQLNLDPRARVAAGLGADVVRRNQEDLMHAAWVQLADVRLANDRLNAARLSLEAARKVYARHFVALPAEQLVSVAAPVHGRTLVGPVTLPEAARPTSLPRATMSPALRRLTSARRPLLRAAGRRAGATFRPAVVARLAAGFEGVDPTRFVPDGVVAMSSLAGLAVPADPDAPVDLAPAGVTGTLRARQMHDQRARLEQLAPMAGQRVELDVRSDGGLLAAAHLEAVEAVTGLDGDERAQLLRRLATAAEGTPGADAFLLGVDPQDRVTANALSITADGTVVIPGRRGRPPVAVGKIDRAFANRPGGLAGLLRSLPPGTIDRTGSEKFTVRRGPQGRPVIERGGVVLEPRTLARPVPTRVVPPLVSDAGVVSRFAGAFGQLGERLQVAAAPEQPALVAFDLAAAASAVLRRTDPSLTVPARVGAMIRFGGRDVRDPPEGIAVAPTLDRVMAYPTFDVPAYLYLAGHDRSRFCPGIDEIPPDSVTLLETNPRFIEAFLVGLNHEMNGELLWRTYPTDQRGTPFRRFWDRADGSPDVGPIHQFAGGRLGVHLTDAEPQLVLLVRGELLRRYPTAAVYAVRSTAQGRLSTREEDAKRPIFAGAFEPDVTFVGFDLQDDDLDQGDGWFFVIQEQPTEPRFGLDDPASRAGAQPSNWQEAAWSDTGVAPGGHLTGPALAAVGLGAVPHAGAVAAALFQRPVRVAVHAKRLVVPEA